MAGFRKDETGVAQTAANTAATLVAAMLTAGVISTIDEAKTEFDSIRANTFADLALVVKADNELFAAVEASLPAAKPRGQSSQGGTGGGQSNAQGGDVTIEFGSLKGKGMTIAQAYALSAEEFAKVSEGKYDKSGVDYITWMSGNDKNPFMAKQATAFLEAKRANSDAA